MCCTTHPRSEIAASSHCARARFRVARVPLPRSPDFEAALRGRSIDAQEAGRPTAKMALPSDPTLERTFRGHRGAINSLAFSADMRQLASGSLDHTVMVWNFRPQLRAYRYVGHSVSDPRVKPRHDRESSISDGDPVLILSCVPGARAMRCVQPRRFAPRFWVERSLGSPLDSLCVRR